MHADWLWGFFGGLLIGLGGTIYLLVNGRIMGASGIVGGLVDGTGRTSRAERISFLGGLVGLPVILGLFTTLPPTHLTGQPLVIIAAGLLVGAGTRLANGCTSGHGVCGISRLSWPGIVATLTYLAAGMASMLVFRHLIGVI
jgi:uncharacterized membrane protein YedE/YeeE